MKRINLFKILGVIAILTIIVFIAVANIIEKTNLENKLYEEQKFFLETYVSENLKYEKIIELFEELSKYIEDRYNTPEIVPTIEFYGKENDNHIILYTIEDEEQRNKYKKEIEDITNTLDSTDNFFVTVQYDKNEEYVVKVIVEYNYYLFN